MSVLGINVSHRVRRRLSGALHEATLYGPTNKKRSDTQESEDDQPARPWAKNWVEDDHVFVRRKSVTEIKNAKHLEKVRDPTIRKILEEHLRRIGIDPHGSKAYPATVFKASEIESEDNTPRMPNKKHPNNPGVPIRRVRMLEESKTFRPVCTVEDNKRRREKEEPERIGQYVKPGNNHHIVYWAEGRGNDEKWSAKVVTMWDAARRAKRGLPMVDKEPKQSKRFVMSLCIGEMFEIVNDDGEVQLCVVRKMDQRSRRVDYKLHIDAREAADINKDNLYLSASAMQKRSARKVTVDPLGRIRWAKD